MTYTESLETYVASQTWLNETHVVEIELLRGVAAHLDTPDGFSPAMVSQFGLWFRALKAQAPREGNDLDELEAELRQAALTSNV